MAKSTENLNIYLPQLILQNRYKYQKNLVIPHSEDWLAVTLFADISGFTALTEKLTGKGLVGIENLSEHLNTYFGKLIITITNYGGDIVKFAGDALLAVWLVAENSLDLQCLTQQVSVCSLAILDELSNYIVDDIALNLHIGIGVGKLWSIKVGGVGGHYKYFVAGEPIQQMTEAEKIAQAGEVCISTAGWQLVQDHLTGVTRSPTVVKLIKKSGQSLSSLPSFSPANIRPVLTNHDSVSESNLDHQNFISDLQGYISPAILSRLEAGQSQWLSELRRITVLFINLPETDLADRSTLQKLQSQIETLQNLLVQYEGSLENLMVDDKGVVAIATFGLPPISHENNSERGLKTAINFAEILHQQRIIVKIGVTTGWAYCGTVGNHLRREYTIIGDVVNLAARLMQLATGEILCDQTTYQATKNYW